MDENKSIIRTLVADPPWYQVGGGKSKRGSDRHYPLMKTPNIIALMCHWQSQLSLAKSAHFYLWHANSGHGCVKDAIAVGEAMGWNYQHDIHWIKMTKSGKLQTGLGWYSRMNCESMSFFTRGKGLDPSVWQGRGTVPSQSFMSPRLAHSEKPLASYINIEKRSKGPYCYFFSRHTRPGWIMFGNESGKLGDIKDRA